HKGEKLKFISKNILNISWSFIGFYAAAVVFAFADDQEKNIIEVFNSLGGFISAGGAVAAILTVITMVQYRKDDRDQNLVKYANYVLFILHRQIRYITMFGTEHLKPHENKPLDVRAYLVPAVGFDPTLVNVIKIEESMFLLAVRRPDLIELLDETQRDYCSMSKQIEQRNSLYISKYQAALQKHKVKIGSNVSVEQVNELIGEYVANELIYSTEQMYKMLPMIQQHLMTVQNDLYDLLKLQYPSYEFLPPLSNVA
ncbi:TPA: hypothetical protein ACPJ2S_004843, partial [Vibrio alginolyticus]|uniref:hypothetical protein n=1 Tax=Vibrio alginolyticus TaxID=663 RepID=UPI00047390A3